MSKALFRLVCPHGERPHILIVPQGDATNDPPRRYEVTDVNMSSLLSDLADLLAKRIVQEDRP